MEERPRPILDRIQELGLFGFILPGIAFDDKLTKVMDKAMEVVAWYRLLYLDVACQEWMVYFLSLLAFASDRQVMDLAENISLGNNRIRARLEAKPEAEEDW